MTTTKLAYAFAIIVPGGFAILALALALRVHVPSVTAYRAGR
jgi:hypothetical protein